MASCVRIFDPKIIKIRQLVFKLQSKMLGMLFWDTVYIDADPQKNVHINSRFIRRIADSSSSCAPPCNNYSTAETGEACSPPSSG